MTDEFLIRTNRLLLRPPVCNDVDGLWPYVTDHGMTTYLAWAPHESKEQTRQVIQSLNQAQSQGTGYHWLIEYDGKICGLISLIDVKRLHREWRMDRAELAYWIGRDFEGRGFVTEACRAVMAFAFDHLGLNKIRVYHSGTNDRSKRVVERLAFRFVGIEKEAFFKHQKWHNLWHYEMLKNEFHKE